MSRWTESWVPRRGASCSASDVAVATSLSVDHLASWAVVITFVIGAMGVVGGGWAYLRHSSHGATVKIQRDEIEALRGRVQTLTEDNLALNFKVESQQEQLTLLRELVTSAAKVDKLRDQVALQHSDVMTALAKLGAERRS